MSASQTELNRTPRRRFLAGLVGIAGVAIFGPATSNAEGRDNSLDLAKIKLKSLEQPNLGLSQERRYRKAAIPKGIVEKTANQENLNPSNLVIYDIKTMGERLYCRAWDASKNLDYLLTVGQDPISHSRRLEILANFPGLEVGVEIGTSATNSDIMTLAAYVPPFPYSKNELIYTRNRWQSYQSIETPEPISFMAITPDNNSIYGCKLAFLSKRADHPIMRIDLAQDTTTEMIVSGIEGANLVTSPTTIREKNGTIGNYALVNQRVAKLTYLSDQAIATPLSSLDQCEWLAEGPVKDGQQVLWAINNRVITPVGQDIPPELGDNNLTIGTIIEYHDDVPREIIQPLLSLYKELKLPGYNKTSVDIRTSAVDLDLNVQFLGVSIIRTKQGQTASDAFPNIEIRALDNSTVRVLLSKKGIFPTGGTIDNIQVVRSNGRKYLIIGNNDYDDHQNSGLYEADITDGLGNLNWLKLTFQGTLRPQILFPYIRG